MQNPFSLIIFSQKCFVSFSVRKDGWCRWPLSDQTVLRNRCFLAFSCKMELSLELTQAQNIDLFNTNTDKWAPIGSYVMFGGIKISLNLLSKFMFFLVFGQRVVKLKVHSNYTVSFQSSVRLQRISNFTKVRWSRGEVGPYRGGRV